jgi:hypothetical protein
MLTYQAEPTSDWELRLCRMIDQVLRLRPAVERYNEMTNLLAGLMMTAGVSEIEVPGQGKVTWQEGKLEVTGEGLAALRPFI